jgi:HIV Tat-specific factor 1
MLHLDVQRPAPEQGLNAPAKQQAGANDRDQASADATASDAGAGDNGGKGTEWVDLKNNTSVYVTGLPDDATPEEVAAEFSKCGVIKTTDDGVPKIKLYKCELRCALCAW